MTKRFVLDTNVLLCDPDALFAFGDNEVVIPIYVLEELDTFKKAQSEIGRNAREVARTLDSLREKGSLHEGIEIGPGGGTLRVTWATEGLPDECHLTNNADNRILATALQQGRRTPGMPTVLVTRDVNLRLRADALGLAAETYEADRVYEGEGYTGTSSWAVDAVDIDDLFASGAMRLEDLELPAGLDPHEFVNLVAHASTSQSALARLYPDRFLRPVRQRLSAWDIEPRNREQRCALSLLLDPEVPLVTLAGPAGTGKTLLAIAAGLAQTADAGTYKRVLVSRPTVAMGRELGYLPGGLDEKLDPWMQAVWDNVELLMANGRPKADTGKGRASRSANGQAHPAFAPPRPRRAHDDLIEMGLLRVEALAFIRGRSIPSQFMIVDEAQNLTPHEVKTIITRAAEGTKLVLTGDPNQIDNPYVDSTNNGLAHVIERFRDSTLAGHVTLTQCERSALAEEAAQRL